MPGLGDASRQENDRKLESLPFFKAQQDTLQGLKAELPTYLELARGTLVDMNVEWWNTNKSALPR